MQVTHVLPAVSSCSWADSGHQLDHKPQGSVQDLVCLTSPAHKNNCSTAQLHYIHGAVSHLLEKKGGYVRTERSAESELPFGGCPDGGCTGSVMIESYLKSQIDKQTRLDKLKIESLALQLVEFQQF